MAPDPTPIPETLAGSLNLDLDSPEAEKGRQRVMRERWLNLPTTSALVHRLHTAQARLTALQANPRTKYLAVRHQTQEVDRCDLLIRDGLARDEAQEQRPAGCWCFGLGGRTRVALPLKGGMSEPFWQECCPGCLEGEAEAERKADIVAAFREHTEALPPSAWEQSGIPTDFRKLRLETSPLNEEYFTLIAALLAGESKSWFFHGLPGRGKTGLAIGFAWCWLKKHRQPVLFVTLPDLLSELRATYNRMEGPTELEIIRKYAEAPFLVLDDLGAEQITGSGWVEDRLYQIVGRRHSNGLTTVYTSNLTLEETGMRLGPRLVSRIQEQVSIARLVPIQGPNLRL